MQHTNIDKQIKLPASEVAFRISNNRKYQEQMPSRNAWHFTRNNRAITVYWNGRGVWITRKVK